MTTTFLSAATAVLVVASFAAPAQTPRESDRRPDARPPIERSQCEAFAGAERERCIAEEESARERLGRAQIPPKSCDDLFGPEKELCLKKGGRIKTGMGANGASAGVGSR